MTIQAQVKQKYAKKSSEEKFLLLTAFASVAW